MTDTVVFFGDSITRGLVSASYIDLLALRLGEERYRFINAGINNDYAYNLLLRVEDVIAHQPQVVTILIGTNDVVATLTPFKGLAGRISKRLPRHPNLAWYWTNLREVVQRLKAETKARIALVSIPVIGEDLDSLANVRVRKYNAAIQELAAREGVSYIGVYDRQAQFLSSLGRGKLKPYQGSVYLTIKLAFSSLFHQESFDSFSRRQGYVLLTDGIHMNNLGAELIADEIEPFLRSLK